jgi:uncharacterized integral membrane protein (TIGR00698 family)
VGRGRAAGRAVEGIRRAVAVLPGLLVAMALAVVASLIAGVTPTAVTAVPLAVLLGIAVGLVTPRKLTDPGSGFATRQVLRPGIVLLGAGLSLHDVAAVGVGAVGLVFVTVATGFLVAWHLGSRIGVTRETAALLGVGTAICGNTAILAAAPVLRARSRDVGLAVATITLCGTAALLVYPVIGRALGLGDVGFGLWVGLAIQDTSQVVAAGAAFSDGARDVATVVKLVRNAALAAVLPLVAWWWGRRAEVDRVPVGWRKAVPVFVLGFLAMVGLRTLGVIDGEVGARLGQVASAAILIAVAGLGMSIRPSDLRRASLRAVAVGGAAAVVLGGIGLAAALVVAPLLE